MNSGIDARFFSWIRYIHVHKNIFGTIRSQYRTVAHVSVCERNIGMIVVDINKPKFSQDPDLQDSNNRRWEWALFGVIRSTECKVDSWSCDSAFCFVWLGLPSQMQLNSFGWTCFPRLETSDLPNADLLPMLLLRFVLFSFSFTTHSHASTRQHKALASSGTICKMSDLSLSIALQSLRNTSGVLPPFHFAMPIATCHAPTMTPELEKCRRSSKSQPKPLKPLCQARYIEHPGKDPIFTASIAERSLNHS
jgi:hypothetical protein